MSLMDIHVGYIRDNSVTIAKALAITLMVVQHSGCPIWLNHYVRIFIMPLFFFMSGYCFKTAYLDDFVTYLKRRIKGVYKPIVKWGSFFLILHNLFYLLNIYNNQFGAITKLYGVNDIIIKWLHVVFTMKDFEPLLGGYWFMNSLLWGSLFFFLSLKLLKPIMGGLFLLVVTFIFSLFEIHVPIFDISAREFLASFFLMSGHAIAAYKVKIDVSWSYVCLFFVIVGLGSYYLAASMLHFNYKILLPYIICAICGIFMTFIIARKISDYFKKKEILLFCGDHTLDVLTWHFLAFKIVSLLIVVVYGLDVARLAELPVVHEYSKNGWWPIYAIIGVSVPLYFRYVYGKLFENE